MKKILAASVLAALATLGLVTMQPPSATAGEAPCKAKEFKTELVKKACEKGQKEAKAVMKTWMKDAKIKSCNACHSKLAPNYELKKDGLKTFQDKGGK